jgi:hypothetical protein
MGDILGQFRLRMYSLQGSVPQREDHGSQRRFEKTNALMMDVFFKKPE